MMGESQLPVPGHRPSCGRSSRQLLWVVAVAVWGHQNTVPWRRKVLANRKVPMHPNTVQRRGADFVQSTPTTRTGRHWITPGRGHLRPSEHNGPYWAAGFRRLADCTTASTSSTVHPQNCLLLLMMLLFLPQQIVHTFGIHPGLQHLPVLPWYHRP